MLHEPKENNEAECDKAAHDDAVSSLSRRYPADNGIDAWNLASSESDAPVNAGQRLPLQVEAVVDGVRLAEDTVRHVVAVVDAIALVKHVLCLGGFRVAGAVLVDVVADIGQQVCPVAGGLEGRAQPRQVSLMRRELFAEQRKVVLLECRRGDCRLAVE